MSKSQEKRLNVQRGGKPWTEEQYIRAGAEQADGFEVFGDGGRISIYGVALSWPISDCPAFIQDAIAAQLKRQVDAISDGNEGLYVNEASNVTSIYRYGGEGQEQLEAAASGPDRTMNTLRCIVDSGVLRRE